MTVGIKLGSITDEIGSSDFFHAFFSTISGNLEPEGWGTRFPNLMRKLYVGELGQVDADEILSELDEIRNELAAIPISKVIWDIENRSKAPPWGDKVADSIANLSEYFVTSTGRDLIDMLCEVIEALREGGGVARVIKY